MPTLPDEHAHEYQVPDQRGPSIYQTLPDEHAHECQVRLGGPSGWNVEQLEVVHLSKNLSGDCFFPM